MALSLAVTRHVALISAHRGGSIVPGESAAERYRRAIRLGVDYIEFDVRRTLDGVIAVCHDPCTGSGRPIAKFAYSELTDELGGEALTFDELLDVADGRVGLHLDLKEPGYETRVVNTALKACPIERLVVTGDDVVIRNVKEEFPRVNVGLSLGEDLEGALPWVKLTVRLKELFPHRRVRDSHADFVAVHRQLASLNVLRHCASAGIPAWVWTVDEESEMIRFLRDFRVTTLITNRPAMALRLRAG